MMLIVASLFSKFQYITCKSSRIQSDAISLFPTYFNTLHVKVQGIKIEALVLFVCYFNTLHVKVQDFAKSVEQEVVKISIHYM